VIYGIGAGWLREESEIMGVDFPHRWTQTAEYVAAMRELWIKPEASFAGKYVHFPAVRSYPKPAQPTGPPVLIGSRDKNALKRVARWGDGWFPNRVGPEDMKRDLATLCDECRAVGRDFAKLDITVMGGIAGDRSAVQAELMRFAEVGVGRFVVAVAGFTPADYDQRLERCAALYVG
jgi:alkanesulfonate monooxygenase SsuD/methylene tetrahydromethanopterin reductase-like flavin-dependent oxidoreductase (luciferase family)